jgi:hypothetical protein
MGRHDDGFFSRRKDEPYRALMIYPMIYPILHRDRESLKCPKAPKCWRNSGNA